MRLHAAPGNVFLKKRVSRLDKDSGINVSQVVTLDKSFLTKRISTIPADKMSEVDEGRCLVKNLVIL